MYIKSEIIHIILSNIMMLQSKYRKISIATYNGVHVEMPRDCLKISKPVEYTSLWTSYIIGSLNRAF